MKIKHTWIVIILLIFIFSCTKSSQEKKIIGSWEYLFFSKNDSNTSITWTFNDDHTMTQFYFNDSYKDTTVANFSLDGNFPQAYYLTITGVDMYNDGKYQILRLTKKFLIIERVEYNGRTQGIYERKEFIKQ